MDEALRAGSLPRAFMILRHLARQAAHGARVTQIAKDLGLTQTTAHRVLQALVAEGVVQQDERTRHYALSLEFFALAACAGDVMDLRSLCRPVLLRLSASLGDTVYLLVRSGFDAICLDRSEGPWPVRAFTGEFSGDVGGRVALGLGQGAMAILAFLPEDEREVVLQYNLPRLRAHGAFDEVYLRTEIERTRGLGYSACDTGLIEGVAGLAVPVLDAQGRSIAAISVGAPSGRLGPDRLPTVAALLQREARALAARVNPFDPTLRRAAHGLGAGGAGGVSGAEFELAPL